MKQITQMLKSLATRVNTLAAQPWAFIVVAVTLLLVGQETHGQHLG